MSTSGSVTGAHVSDGNENSYLDWQLASQDTAGNFSTINWQAGWHFVTYSCRGLRQGNAVVNGTTVWHDFDSGDGVHAFNGAHDHRSGSGKLECAHGQIKITHNSDGTKSFSGSISLVGFSSQTSAGSASFSLPTISRIPSVPTKPFVEFFDQTSVRISWVESTSGGPGPYTYTIGYGKDPDTPEHTTTSSSTLKTITGLDPASNYYFWVKATNAVGTSAYSPSSLVHTIAGARVMDGGVWKEAVPYVRDGGVWKLARPWVKAVGEWREGQ